MPVPPGYSFGDLVAAIKLIRQVVQAFNSAKGAKKQCQSAFLFLQAFQQNLELIHKFMKEVPQRPYAEALDTQLELVRLAYNTFEGALLEHIVLVSGSKKLARDVWAKLKWTFVNNEVEKLRGDVAETFATLHIWIDLEANSRMARLIMDGNHGIARVEGEVDGISEGIDVLVARQERLEDKVQETVAEWRHDIKKESARNYTATDSLIVKVEQQGQALEGLQEQTQVLVKHLEASIAQMEAEARTQRQLRVDAEEAAERAKREDKLEMQKRALASIKRSSQDAGEYLGATVRSITASDRVLANMDVLVAGLDKTLKAISIRSMALRVWSEVRRAGLKVGKTSRDAAFTVRDQTVVACQGLQDETNKVLLRRKSAPEPAALSAEQFIDAPPLHEVQSTPARPPLPETTRTEPGNIPSIPQVQLSPAEPTPSPDRLTRTPSPLSRTPPPLPINPPPALATPRSPPPPPTSPPPSLSDSQRRTRLPPPVPTPNPYSTSSRSSLNISRRPSASSDITAPSPISSPATETARALSPKSEIAHARARLRSLHAASEVERLHTETVRASSPADLGQRSGSGAGIAPPVACKPRHLRGASTTVVPGVC